MCSFAPAFQRQRRAMPQAQTNGPGLPPQKYAAAPTGRDSSQVGAACCHFLATRWAYRRFAGRSKRRAASKPIMERNITKGITGAR